MHNSNNNIAKTSFGYYIAVIGVAIILAWIGAYKFTPTEANLIQPLVANHPAMNWLFQFLSIQMVSNFIGAIEILVAIGLIIGFKDAKVGYLSGIIAAIIFIFTLSFLLTTPNTWKISDGFLITNFFILKDIVFLGVAISVIERNKPYVLGTKTGS